MNSLVWLYIVVYGLSVGTIVFIGFFLQLRKESSYGKGELIKLEDLVVLIPFRNEEERITVLLESINRLTSFPDKFIFINDHSEDNGVKLIQDQLKNVPYEILDLPTGIAGKKMALRHAMNNLNAKYLLTLDADVYFNTDFFSQLASLSQTDMYLRPAIMKADRLIDHLYEIDLALVNAANVGLAGWKRPIMASGANLLYDKAVFDEVDSIEKHSAIASGDDMYLLKDFREHKKEVRLVSGTEHAIYTETPQSFKEFIDQRLRWLGKTTDLKDHLSTFLAVIQSVLTLVFFGLIVFFIATSSWKNLMMVLVLKTLVDMLVFLPYLKRINRLLTWLFIPVYELVFPFYNLVILSLMYTYKPTWKGRKIKHSN